MKIKREELAELIQGISSINLPGAKFNYALLKTKKKMQKELEILSGVVKYPKEYNEFEDKRVEICKKYCKKDDKGTAIVKNDKYEGLTDNAEFDSAVKKLKVEYKVTLDARDKQIAKYKKLLLEEVEISIHKILLRDVPDSITTKQLEAIMPLVEETTI